MFHRNQQRLVVEHWKNHENPWRREHRTSVANSERCTRFTLLAWKYDGMNLPVAVKGQCFGNCDSQSHKKRICPYLLAQIMEILVRNKKRLELNTSKIERIIKTETSMNLNAPIQALSKFELPNSLTHQPGHHRLNRVSSSCQLPHSNRLRLSQM